MKIVYAGTPEFAVPPLQRLLQTEGVRVVGVVTQEDKPQGRKGVLTPPPVKRCAAQYGVPVYQFDKIRCHVSDLAALGADIMITCAYGQILTQDVIDLFPQGVWNLHASLLPKYRGAAPIQWCVKNGETVTGVTVMKTDIGLDTGDMLLAKRLLIGAEETAGELSSRLSLLAAEAAAEAVDLIRKGDVALMLQDESAATTVKKITRAQALIPFDKEAADIVNHVRAMNPEPVAYAMLAGKPFNVYKASAAAWDGDEENGVIVCAEPKKGLLVKCKGGAVRLDEVQPAGGKRMKGSDLLNGRKVAKGQRFDF